ncbi:S8 family peptidase [Thermomonospora sp. CIF 1]|uniref:S8 family peptidase n=1 Tax=Thermomonospora sp. CIF 1 TaxID=1916083 RepID=UPI000A827877|nr:S8 family peptidase [Thermomonospora sp. CIF 1]PKK16152.1 MAG: peptidase S8/S53 subtilisin kexin sedolisin [Thermomonospora sp. CIF 1]
MRVTGPKVLLITTLATGVAVATAVPLLAKPEPVLVQVAANGTPVPGQYIVTLKPGASTAAEAGRIRATGVRRFDGVLNGFSAKLTAEQLDKLRRSDKVAAIEQDQIVRIGAVQRAPLPWGLDRIDQRVPKLSKSYTYKSTGKGVRVYVIDTGIKIKHKQFGKRARSVWAAPRFKGNHRDQNGHGTHVAGIIGAKHYGVAKGVQLRSLRVLDRYGQGMMSDVIAAVKWLRKNAQKPAVANLSLVGSRSKAANDAVAALARSGVPVIVAAGNGDGASRGYDACRFSPSGAPNVIAVGAIAPGDKRTPWSNFGKCVDLHAPGQGIRSTWRNGSSKVLDGTSMAAPFAAGTAALYLSRRPRAKSATVYKWLINNASKGRVTGLPAGKGTPNRLLYKGRL